MFPAVKSRHLLLLLLPANSLPQLRTLWAGSGTFREMSVELQQQHKGRPLPLLPVSESNAARVAWPIFHLGLGEWGGLVWTPVGPHAPGLGFSDGSLKKASSSDPGPRDWQGPVRSPDSQPSSPREPPEEAPPAVRCFLGISLS